MASQKEKLIAEALKLVEKGQYDRAVKTYLRVVAEDDKDVRIWLKIGDLYTKLRKNHDAAETYQRVAQFYSDQGFYTKAIAVYKQILKLDPSMVDVYERLAELYKQMGVLPDAIEQYAAVAAHHQKTGDMRAALAALKQIVELDPHNVASRVKLAEMYSKEQMVREAIDEFARAAEFLHEQGRYDDYMKVAERLLFHSPDNRPVSRELARLYLQKGDARRALPRLQVCFKADPRDVETLSLLADAFDALGQKVKAVSVLKELVRIHSENGASSAADETWRRVLALAPGDVDARGAMGGSAPPPTPPGRESPSRPPPSPGSSTQPSLRAQGAPPPLASLDLSTAPAPRTRPPTVEVPAVKRNEAPPATAEVPTVRRFEGPPPPPMLVAPRPAQIVTPPFVPPRGPVQQAALFTQTISPVRDPNGPAGQTSQLPRPTPSSIKVTGSQPLVLGIDEAEVAKVLNETDVFMKYNLHAKAVEHVRTVFERDPYNQPARQKLKDVLVTLGRHEEALDELKQLAQIAAGTPAETGYLEELVALAPGEQWASDRLAALAGGAVVQAADGGDTTSELPVDLEVDLDGMEELSSQDLEVDDAAIEGAPVDVSFDEPVESADFDDEIPLVIDGTEAAPQPLAAGAEEIEDRFGADLDEPGATEEHEIAPSLMSVEAEEPVAPPLPIAVPAPEAVDNFDFSSFDDPSATPAPAPPLAVARADSAPRLHLAPAFAVAEDGAPEAVLAEASGPSGSGIEDELEEAEFYAQQGMVDEARDALRELLVRYPAHPLVVARMRDLDAVAMSPESSAEATVSVAVDSIVAPGVAPGVDPGAAHAGDELGATPQSAASAVPTRKNVVEKGINEDDFESHFDLGIAYREMGLVDDAITEFNLVMRDPNRQVQCRQMLGMCYLAKGSTHEAITHFKQGLYAEGIHEDEEISLYYELGQAYEKLNDITEALYYYERISKRKPRYRDVERRIKLLAPPAADAL